MNMKCGQHHEVMTAAAKALLAAHPLVQHVSRKEAALRAQAEMKVTNLKWKLFGKYKSKVQSQNACLLRGCTVAPSLLEDQAASPTAPALTALDALAEKIRRVAPAVKEWTRKRHGGRPASAEGADKRVRVMNATSHLRRVSKVQRVTSKYPTLGNRIFPEKIFSRRFPPVAADEKDINVASMEDDPCVEMAGRVQYDHKDERDFSLILNYDQEG